MSSRIITLILIIAALAGGLIVQPFSLSQRIDNIQYDLFHRLAAERRPAENTVLIAVTHQNNPGEPDRPLLFWGSRYAEMIDKLRQAGTAAVGLDYLPYFSARAGVGELSEETRQAAGNLFDRPLQQQLSRGRVIMTSLLTADGKGRVEEDLPHQDYLFPLLSSGSGMWGPANLDTSIVDGVVRTFISNFSPAELEPRYGFAPLLAQMAGAGIESVSSSQPIGYIGPPGTVPRITRQQLIQAKPGDPLLGRVKGKVAIIAADHAGNQDLHETPYGDMNGAEIQANTVETLISGKYPRPAGQWLNLAVTLGLVMVALPLFQRLSLWYGILLLPLLLLATFGLAYAAFLQDIRLVSTLPQAGLILLYLGSAATRVSREQRARQHTYTLLSRYVSEPVAKRISRSEKLPDLGGETMEVTILFSDIRGFTTLSEKLNPAEVVELLNIYFSQVCSVVIDNGGAIDKFIGDALMAVFGAPEPSGDHAEKALLSAEQMVRRAERFNDWLQQRFADYELAPFRIGVGLHTGSVVAGNIGADMRMEYTVIGDAVNVSSRLEGQCKNLGWPIVASRETLVSAGKAETVTEWEELQVKGRNKPVEVGHWTIEKSHHQ